MDHSIRKEGPYLRNFDEEKTRESVLGRLSDLKKEIAERPRNQVISKKHKGPELD